MDLLRLRVRILEKMSVVASYTRNHTYFYTYLYLGLRCYVEKENWGMPRQIALGAPNFCCYNLCSGARL